MAVSEHMVSYLTVMYVFLNLQGYQLVKEKNKMGLLNLTIRTQNRMVLLSFGYSR